MKVPMLCPKQKISRKQFAQIFKQFAQIFFIFFPPETLRNILKKLKINLGIFFSSEGVKNDLKVPMACLKMKIFEIFFIFFINFAPETVKIF